MTGYRLVSSLRYAAATAKSSISTGAVKIVGSGKNKALTISVRNTGNTLDPVTGTIKLKSALGTKNASVKGTRILPGKSIRLPLVTGNALKAGQLHGHDHAHAGQEEDDRDQEGHGAPLSDLAALLEAAPLDGRRIRAVAALAGHEPAEIVARTGVTLREVERILAAGGKLPPRVTPREDGALARMRERLAGVPEPLADLDHVQATAETVLARVRVLHERYELERCRVLLLGDHDATSLAFEVLGVRPRELCVVDVDQRQLAFLAGRRHLVRRPARRAAGAAARTLRHRADRSAVLARGRRACSRRGRLRRSSARRGCWWPTAIRRARPRSG